MKIQLTANELTALIRAARNEWRRLSNEAQLTGLPVWRERAAALACALAKIDPQMAAGFDLKGDKAKEADKRH